MFRFAVCFFVFALTIGYGFDVHEFLDKLENTKGDVEEYVVDSLDQLQKEYPVQSEYSEGLLNELLSFKTYTEANSWEFFPLLARYYSSLVNGYHTSENAEEFYKIGVLKGGFSKKMTSQMLDTLTNAKSTPLQQSDIEPSYFSSVGFSSNQESIYNSRNKFFLMEDEQFKVIGAALEEIKEEIAEALGAPWRVLNIRSWATHPSVMQHDPNGGWHSDGIHNNVYKLMIYPRGCGSDKGTTEIKKYGPVVGGKGTWALFKSTQKMHRTIAPKYQAGAQDRWLIEVTLTPALDFDIRPYSAGLLSMRPHVAWFNYLNDCPEEINGNGYGINIGGGRNWSRKYWINLEKSGDGEGKSFILSPHCRFPIESESISTIHSSHVFEHLDDATIMRVFSEAKRVLVKGGTLIIKIPDYDEALAAWKARDLDYFSGRVWDFPTELFQNYNVEDCLDTRAAFLFGSFATPELNGLFSGKETLDNPKAYFGPPIVSPSELRTVSFLDSPHQVAFALRKMILDTNPGTPDFCHQNAWSRKEMVKLFKQYGFKQISVNKDEFLGKWGYIPWMKQNMRISMVCFGKKE